MTEAMTQYFRRKVSVLSLDYRRIVEVHRVVNVEKYDHRKLM